MRGSKTRRRHLRDIGAGGVLGTSGLLGLAGCLGGGGGEPREIDVQFENRHARRHRVRLAVAETGGGETLFSADVSLAPDAVESATFQLPAGDALELRTRLDGADETTETIPGDERERLQSIVVTVTPEAALDVSVTYQEGGA